MTSSQTSRGKLYGVGIGPGDPELITLKAYRIIQDADVLCYLCNAEDQTRITGQTHSAGHSQAKSIVKAFIDQRKVPPQELAIAMGYKHDRSDANARYDQAAEQIRIALDQGKDVAFLCEGDPLFFGSYAYLQERLCDQYSCEVIPGISAPQAAGAVAGIPLAMQTENYAVLSGRLDSEALIQQLTNFDNLVIMKAGRARPRIIDALKETGRLEDATYVEYATRDNQRIVYDLNELDNEAGPYFSLFIVTRHSDLRKWS
ncbi:precorrin-2 C(20)-methyltransferase [Litoribacillus peritrichatus]|uniref:Precorrin-2 C(20)-methyltransferase n=1 Tax=Litoribacillus peritrichatus TaxID=718191 RepID=A0ABP7MEX2_9GAMM